MQYYVQLNEAEQSGPPDEKVLPFESDAEDTQ
jgi:hypothetical protein